MLSELSKSSSALITAAGASARMGTGRKKELELIDGVSVIERAVAPFIETDFFSHIVITHSRGDREAIKLILGNMGSSVDCIFVEGGDSRQQSVYNGLVALEDLAQRYLLIHDGSRPWITPLLIRQVLDGTIRYGACMLTRNRRSKVSPAASGPGSDNHSPAL